MWKQIEKKIKEYAMIRPGDRVLVGVSGGADSMCLAEMLFLLKEELGFEMAVMHCHHGLRGEEADGDMEFVRNYAKERNLPFYLAKENVEKRAKEQKLSVEEAGRMFRYENFARIMETENYQVLAVAHHGDDRTETMLFHMARGTDLAGLCAMEPMRMFASGKKVIRPLLWNTKAEIEKWLSDRKLVWRNDETNKDVNYTRNRIRKEVIPPLLAVNDRLHEHMGELAESAGEAFDFIRTETEKLMEACFEREEAGAKRILFIPELKKAHPYLIKHVLYETIARTAGSRKDITRVHVELLKDLIEKESGREVHLLLGIKAKREYDRLILWCGDQEMPEEGGLEEEKYTISMEILPYSGEEISKNEYTKYFDCDKIKSKACLRYWEEGDYFYLGENGGKKMLARYFIDAKVPPSQRKKIPLLADGNHIMWIFGHRISGHYKVTQATKRMLKVTIENK